MNKNLKRDFITGASNSFAVCDALYSYAREEKDTPSFVIAGDFMNMGGLNQALGRKAGNEFLKLAAGIYDEEFSALQPKHLYALRESGDEMTFIVRGVEEQKLHEAISAAQKRVTEFVEQSGIGNLRHQKYEHLAGAGFFTAVVSIHDGADTFSETYNLLQEKITQQKKSLPPFSGVVRDAGDYVNTSSTERFNDSLEKTAWNKTGFQNITLPDDLPETADASINRLKTREERTQDTQGIIEADPATLLRCDLYNLGGLNAQLGPVSADHIIQHMTRIAQEETQKKAPDARFYNAGAGVMDILLPGYDEKFITDIKKEIHRRVFEEILSKSITAYADEFQLPEMGNTLIGQIPYKDGSHSGVGLVLSHTSAAPQTKVVTSFSRLDTISYVQKMHAAAFLERLDDGRLKRYNLFPVGKSISQYDVIDNIDPDTPHAIPYAHSLKFDLTAKMIMNVFEKPCGLICQEVFGIDLNPVVERQTVIQNLLKFGVAPEEIASKTDSLLQFDFWHKSRKGHTQPANLLDRANTQITSDPRLMTFSLARRWNILPQSMHDLPETILMAQAALRSTHELNISTPGISPADSLSFLEKDIRTHVAKEPDADLRRIQACEQAMKALEHARNALGFPSNERTLTAASVLIRGAFDEVVKRLEKSGEPYIAHLFSDIRHNPDLSFNKHGSTTNPEKILQEDLANVTRQLTTRTDLPPEQVTKVLQNMQSLQTALSSQPHATPAATPAKKAVPK